MEITETICHFIFVRLTSYRESGGVVYPGNIAILSNQGYLLAAKIERFQDGKGGGGFRTVLLTMDDIEDE